MGVEVTSDLKESVYCSEVKGQTSAAAVQCWSLSLFGAKTVTSSGRMFHRFIPLASVKKEHVHNIYTTNLSLCMMMILYCLYTLHVCDEAMWT